MLHRAWNLLTNFGNFVLSNIISTENTKAAQLDACLYLVVHLMLIVLQHCYII